MLVLGAVVYLLYDRYGTEAKEWLSGLMNEQYDRIEQAQTDGENRDMESVLPAVYDCRRSGKAPTVKNQGELGTCWAVAASSALESGLLPEESVTFSAEHIFMQNGYEGVWENGGASMMSAAYLAAWKGPVTEEQDPYGDGMSVSDAEAVRHVQEIQMVSERDDTRIKQLVYDYGAIQSSVYMDMEDEQVSTECYNPQYASYFYDGNAEVNHDILIIGWDDMYPAENFNNVPPKDGAFICQNSWGENFGENGIFYVSYADTGIGKNCAAYTRVEAADNYDNIYQSDLCGYVGQAGYGKDECWFANIYTAQNEEILRAVGFYAVGADSSYEIRVAEDFQNIFSLVLAEKVQEGEFTNSGFYTVDLNRTFRVEEGQKFAVIVRIKTPGAEYPAAMEYRADLATQSVILDDGEGYISPDGYRWTETETEYEGNVCLKVYTDNE